MKPKEKAVKAAVKTVKAKAAKPKEKAVKAAENDLKAMELFKAFGADKLPKDHAYIVSTFVNAKSGYTIYEVISYSGVKAIYIEGDGLTFQSSGKKMHILIEPPSYPQKATEPFLREKADQIPLRFKELNVINCKNQIRIYMAQKPIDSLSSFTVAKPVGYNVSYLFYDLPDIYDTLSKFFVQTFNKDAMVPQADAKKAAKEAVSVIEKLMTFTGDFGGQ